ncbi:MAG: ABC transporter permease [Actinomycetota bacterium]|nr:ABC transporter permease [Actinomycetota bacterium]
MAYVMRAGRFPLVAIRTQPGLFMGCLISGIAILLAVIGPWIAPMNPTEPVSGQQLLPPSSEHWFGTDPLGYDVFSRVIAAPRTDITIALAATILAIVVGAPIGAVAGYYQTAWSSLVMRISDLIQSFPVFLLAMAAVIVAGNEISSIIYVIALVQAPIYVRLVRAEVLALRSRTFVEAAVTMGVPGKRIVRRHLLPNAVGPILSQASVTVGMAMLLTAGLSFIGAGVRVPTPEWGSMIAAGAPNVITGQWWASVFPGLALAITVFGFALLGDGLARLSDPTRRKP